MPSFLPFLTALTISILRLLDLRNNKGIVTGINSSVIKTSDEALATKLGRDGEDIVVEESIDFGTFERVIAGMSEVLQAAKEGKMNLTQLKRRKDLIGKIANEEFTLESTKAEQRKLDLEILKINEQFQQDNIKANQLAMVGAKTEGDYLQMQNVERANKEALYNKRIQDVANQNGISPEEAEQYLASNAFARSSMSLFIII